MSSLARAAFGRRAREQRQQEQEQREREERLRAGSATEIDCEELQQPLETEHSEDGGRWRRYLQRQPASRGTADMPSSGNREARAGGATALAPVAPAMATEAAERNRKLDEELRTGKPATLASHMMWKLAMRMSSHYENRLLQHISRSILSRGAHKHEEKRRYALQQPKEDNGRSDSRALIHWSSPRKPKKTAATQNRRADGRVQARATRGAPHSDPDAVSHPEAGRTATPPCSASSAATAPTSRHSGGGSASIGALPPFPPLVFSPSKGRKLKRTRAMTLEQYKNWAFPGLRPGLSVRVVRCETTSTMPAATEYVLHVVDLHTRVFWITKKRFSDLFQLRRRVRAMVRHAPEAEDDEKDELRFLLDLPFPRRRFRPSSVTAVTRGMGDIEVFLRNLAALEPQSTLQRSLLLELQREMCSAEFVTSLEKIDTSGEPIEPKWLGYDLFRRLNSEGAVEGSTCYRFVHAFRNRADAIEAAICPECNSAQGPRMAAEAVKDLRNTVTSIEKYIAEKLDPQYADTLSLLEQSVDVGAVLDDCIFHAVEDTVLVPLEKQVSFLVSSTVDEEAERRLARNIERLRSRSQSESGIPEHLQSDDGFGLSCHHLNMIDERTLAVDKIQELLRAALEVFKSCGEKNLEWRENSALTADDYLPIHIYVVVHSGLKRPLVTKELLGAMIHPSQMLGEIGYFLTMFEVALKYIADM